MVDSIEHLEWLKKIKSERKRGYIKHKDAVEDSIDYHEELIEMGKSKEVG